MSERQILLAIGTRPEAIKLAPVALALRREPWASVRVMTTSQHRHLVQPALAAFGVGIDRDLDVMRPGQSLVALSGRLMLALDPAIVQERPDLAIVQGDTTTAFAVAFACAMHRIPVAHVEAGLRSGDRAQPFPEEHNRELITRVRRGTMRRPRRRGRTCCAKASRTLRSRSSAIPSSTRCNCNKARSTRARSRRRTRAGSSSSPRTGARTSANRCVVSAVPSARWPTARTSLCCSLRT